jgi:quercetin dioxygenase-like cupin family protein
MKKFKLEDFTRGWIVGDFTPTILHSKDFEFMVREYKKDDKEDRHMHKIAEEITVIVSGKFMMNGELLSKGDIVHLLPGENTDFVCIEDGVTAVVKTPSVKNDKYLV